MLPVSEGLRFRSTFTSHPGMPINMRIRNLLLGLSLVVLTLQVVSPSAFATSRRQTPLVQAVERAKTAVVNIHTEKSGKDSDNIFGTGKSRRITGMGTGIVLDPRGYIITNYHVVADVEKLEISLIDGPRMDARLITFDRGHDLALIKADYPRELDVMPMGTSSDLMLGETVIAIGNAFGYVHTVTSGIVSSLSRDVEVNETQSYQNLIQTDASINPGNSGGPLVNLDGEVIGINVAIRAGAQRIGFAIPIDDARTIIARLLSAEMLEGRFHGLQTTDKKKGTDRSLLVVGAKEGSPAKSAGFKSGDRIISVRGKKVIDRVDFERMLLGLKNDEPVQVVVNRQNDEKTLNLSLGTVQNNVSFAGVEKATPSIKMVSSRKSKAWQVLGVGLAPLPKDRLVGVSSKYRGGMMITSVRPNSPAASNGMRKGDILVGLHVWETINIDNVSYVIDHPQLNTFSPLKFYILRGKEVLYGHLPVNASRR